MTQYRMSVEEARAKTNKIVQLMDKHDTTDQTAVDMAIRCLGYRFNQEEVFTVVSKTLLDTTVTLCRYLDKEITQLNKTKDLPISVNEDQTLDRRIQEVVELKQYVHNFYSDKTLRLEGSELVSGRYSLTDFIQMYDAGHFNLNRIDDLIEAGWYDWFCKDHTLGNRTKKMISMVKAAAKSPAVDPDKVYVFFKNNCPMSGPLYDSFSICSLDKGDVLFWATAKCGHTGQAEVVEASDFGHNVLETTGGIPAVKHFFQNITPSGIQNLKREAAVRKSEAN